MVHILQQLKYSILQLQKLNSFNGEKTVKMGIIVVELLQIVQILFIGLRKSHLPGKDLETPP